MKLNSFLLFSENPSRLADFYAKIFDMKPGWEEGGYVGFMVGGTSIVIGPHDKVKGMNNNPERFIFNLEVKDEEFKAEAERIKQLATKVIQEPYQPGEAPDSWIATYADPDGNYFQLATEFKM